MNASYADLPLPISPLSLGAWAFAGGPLWGDQDEAASIATIHAALDAGITMIDTAPGYGGGLSEEIVGRGLQGHRDRTLIATKVNGKGMESKESLVAACEDSLRRLQTDRIDLLQIHWLGLDAPLDDIIAGMESLRDAGKVLTLGVCNFGPKSLARLSASGTGWITNQLCYNLLWRAVEYEITDACEQSDMGILCYSPLQQGLLTGRFAKASEVPAGRNRTRHFNNKQEMAQHNEDGQEELTFRTINRIRTIARELNQPMADVALAWLLHQRGVSSVIFGARSPEQVASNMRAAQLKLDTTSLNALNQASDKLKQALGKNADLWAAKSRII